MSRRQRPGQRQSGGPGVTIQSGAGAGAEAPAAPASVASQAALLGLDQPGLTLAALRSEVRRQLDDDTAAFVTDADIDDSLNEGYEEMSEATLWYERQFMLPLLSRRTYYNVRELAPDEPLGVSRCWNTVTQKWLDPDSVRALDGRIRQWELNAGEPRSYFMRGHWWLGVWPKPASDDISRVRVYYTAIPPPMTLDTDVPGFPPEFHWALVDYALYDTLIQDREPGTALAHYSLYLTYRDELMRYVGRRQSLDRAPGLKG